LARTIVAHACSKPSLHAKGPKAKGRPFDRPLGSQKEGR
jgi:hypothetical protein